MDKQLRKCIDGLIHIFSLQRFSRFLKKNYGKYKIIHYYLGPHSYIDIFPFLKKFIQI